MLSVVIFFIPYTLPGATYASLDAYVTFSLIPQSTGAFLRGRKGALAAWLFVTLGIICKILLDQGLSWPPAVITSSCTGALRRHAVRSRHRSGPRQDTSPPAGRNQGARNLWHCVIASTQAPTIFLRIQVSIIGLLRPYCDLR